MVWTCDKDWVKKCMEFRVEGRRPVGIPKRTWLESVEADMAELEIDKEDVHDRNKWGGQEVVQPHRKMDYKPIIKKFPNIALQDKHSVLSIVFLATYPDTNNKGDKSSSLAHNISMVS